MTVLCTCYTGIRWGGGGIRGGGRGTRGRMDEVWVKEKRGGERKLTRRKWEEEEEEKKDGKKITWRV